MGGGVFDNIIRKGALGGFGLENLGEVGKLNGRMRLPNDFTPTELKPEPQQVEEIDDREFEQQQPQQAPEPQPNFFGENDSQQQQQPEFFGSVMPKKNVVGGIPKEANFFGQLKKPNKDKPLIGNLKEGVDFFDSSFTKNGQAPPLKRGTGFDNFVGDIDINALSRGKPDSAVPKSGIFAKGNQRKGIIRKPVDLSQMNQNVSLLPNPEGFDNINFEESVESFNEVPTNDHTHAKTNDHVHTGRPKGSLGKKKRQAKKLEASKNKKKKKKKVNELTKSRISILKERERLKKGGVPRNSFQGETFKAGGVSPNTQDNSFRSFFT